MQQEQCKERRPRVFGARSRILRWQSGAAGWRWFSVEEMLELELELEVKGKEKHRGHHRGHRGHRGIGAVFCGHLERRSRSDPTMSGRSFLPPHPPVS